MKIIKVMKDGYDGEIDDNPNHAKFDSRYGTLKYFQKAAVDVLLPAGDQAAQGIFNHNLGYIPYAEVYVAGSGGYDYCPSYNSGASVAYNSTYILTPTQVLLYVGSSGFFNDQIFNFLIFLYKNKINF